MGEESNDIKILITKALNNWYLFAIFLTLFLGLGYYFIKTTAPTFEAKALLLLKEDKKSEFDQESLFADLEILQGRKVIENEIQVLSSTPLMEEVIRNLELQYMFDSIGSLRNYSLYGTSPIEVLNWEPNFDGVNISGEIHLLGEGAYEYRIEDVGDYRGEFGTPLRLPDGTVTLGLAPSSTLKGPLLFSIYDPNSLAKIFVKRVLVSSNIELATTIDLSFEDESAQRAMDILNELLRVYLERNVGDKERIFQGSIDLLDERIKLVAGELSASERNLETFKRRFNTIDVSSEESFLFKDLSEQDQKLAGLDVQLEILQTTEDFLTRNRDNFNFVPTNQSITNLTLSNQLASFNELLRERSRMRSELGPAHPDLRLTERQIQNLRSTIIENIKAIKGDILITRNATEDLRESVQTRISSMPRQERELVEMERTKDIKENLYLYLLQKREEAIISLSIIAPSGRVIEPANSSNSPVAPKKMLIMAVAGFLGLMIPAGIVYLMFLVNNKVQMEDNLGLYTSVPVAALIPQAKIKNKDKNRLVVKSDSRNAASEMFRLLRTNMAYIRPGETIQSLIVTSSMPGEGKSFIAINFSAVQALSGKKTVLIEMDFRQPKLSEYFNLSKEPKGVVNYLIDHDLELSDITQPIEGIENLDFISCGVKPPNPGDLILTERLRDLMATLREQYDMIILDAPPVGLVSDPLQISDLADATMYVVRLGKTRKTQLKIIENIGENQKMPNPFIVLNGVNLKRASYHYGYGYSPNKYYTN